MKPNPPPSKDTVVKFWDRASCGERYAEGDSERDRLRAQMERRYELEPFIVDFAQFGAAGARDVLEIGVGMGADHLQLALNGPRSLIGIDLTQRAVQFTRRRCALWDVLSNVFVADAENLPFGPESFDVVYSWGVLHHSPDTPRAIREIGRVLRSGGVARVMIYHRSAIVGYLLWLRYALLAGRPRRSLMDVYAAHLESPGTKAYSEAEAAQMFAGFREVQCAVQLSPGDLLEGAAGQRHKGFLLRMGRRLWPRWLIRRLLCHHGLYLMIEARK